MGFLTEDNIIPIAMVLITAITAFVNYKSSKASEHQVEASVNPYIYFTIRPRSDYDDPKVTYPRRGWVRGTGIYIQNLGAAPAFNYTLSIEVIPKEGDPRSYDKKFSPSRLPVGVIYTYPSEHWNELKILDTDKRVKITVDYYDRIGHPHIQEPVEIELKDSDCDEYSFISLSVGDVGKLNPEDVFSVPVEYRIATTSDWTTFSIISEERWESGVTEKILGGNSVKNEPMPIGKTIVVESKSAGTSILVSSKTMMSIPKIKREIGVVQYSIRKGDLGNTTVTVLSGAEVIDTFTNAGKTVEPDNYRYYDLAVSKHIPAGE